MSDIALHVENVTGAHLSVADSGNIPLDIGGSMYAVGPPYFDGPYEVTPGEETQMLLMKDMRASDHVTVNPIPSNYGLITWDGSVITVS